MLDLSSSHAHHHRYAKPISVARRVLECSSANMLVGDGATQFARMQRFPLEDNERLLTTETKEAYEVILTEINCYFLLTFLLVVAIQNPSHAARANWT